MTLKKEGSFGPFRLTLIGEGPLRAELAALVQAENLSAEVTFCGQLPRPALLEQMLGMDVCILPSLTESFCKARLDAFLCGVPVITTDVGFGREIVGSDGERGWILPNHDAQDLAAVIKRAVKMTGDWPSLRGSLPSIRQGLHARTMDRGNSRYLYRTVENLIPGRKNTGMTVRARLRGPADSQR